MKGFARSVPQMAVASRLAVDEQVLERVADARTPLVADRLADRDQVQTLLDRLSERERQVLSAHFGLDRREAPETYEQVGRSLGLSKQRVRQIEQTALGQAPRGGGARIVTRDRGDAGAHHLRRQPE